MNFNYLRLKKLITTCYTGAPGAGEQLPLFHVVGIQDTVTDNKHPYKIGIVEVTDENQDGANDFTDMEILLKNRKHVLTLLEGDGDFGSAECIELLKEADIVVTNPPFSLFREYVVQLVEYGKKFIIIGSKNAITYKEIFPLIKENKMRLGNGFPNGNAFFRIPEKQSHEWASGVYNQETGLVKFRNVGWFTNLDLPKRHERLILYKQYNSEKYPNSDNYNAKEVIKTAEIPYDYNASWVYRLYFLISTIRNSLKLSEQPKVRARASPRLDYGTQTAESHNLSSMEKENTKGIHSIFR